MTLIEIKTALALSKTQTEFEDWVNENYEELSFFFYSQSIEELVADFDGFYFGDFLASESFKAFHNLNNHTEIFDSFLYLLAHAAERLAENSFESVLESLIELLPICSIKFRLKALYELNNINNIKSDYFKLFIPILSLLDEARFAEAEVSEYHLVDILIYYYSKAHRAFSKANLLDLIIDLRLLFTDQDLISKHDYLGHAKIQALVKNDVIETPIQIDTHLIDTIVPSAPVERIFSKLINELVFNHDLTNMQARVLMGFNIDEILNDALLRGRADFRVNYKQMTAESKVLLYCYFNMKKHYFTSYGVYSKIWEFFNAVFSDLTFKPLFIDLGCGPLTSGIAIADLFYTKTGEYINFQYIGIDISPAMLNQALLFFNTELFVDCPPAKFETDWNNIAFDYLKSISGKNHPVIINASYLFASEYLNVADLANYISKLVAYYQEVFFIFQNPRTENRNQNYFKFKQLLEFSVVDTNKDIDNDAIKYQTKRLSEIKREELLYEVLKFKKQ